MLEKKKYSESRRAGIHCWSERVASYHLSVLVLVHNSRKIEALVGDIRDPSTLSFLQHGFSDICC